MLNWLGWIDLKMVLLKILIVIFGYKWLVIYCLRIIVMECFFLVFKFKVVDMSCFGKIW